MEVDCSVKQDNWKKERSCSGAAGGDFYGSQYFAWGQRFKESVCRVGWVRDDLTCMLLALAEYRRSMGSSLQPMIFSAERMQPLNVRSVWGNVAASDGWCEDGLDQDCLWQVQLLQLPQEEHPLLGLPGYGTGDVDLRLLEMVVPRNFKRHSCNCGAVDGEWRGRWGGSGGVLLKSTVISTVLRVFSSRQL